MSGTGLAPVGESSRRWLVVGLGNPGPDYATTRHNAGFMVADLLASRVGGRFKAHRGRADLVEGSLAAPGAGPRHLVAVMKPKAYMNESGGPVAAMRDFFKVPLDRIVVVHDELDLPFGVIRLKLGGGDGGHNGLRSVTKSLGGPGYLRVRFGIGRPLGSTDPAVFVLKPFTSAQARDVPVLVDRAADAVTDLVVNGLQAAQNRFHPAGE